MITRKLSEMPIMKTMHNVDAGNLYDKENGVISVAVGASPVNEETVEEIRNNNFSRAELKIIQFYYLRGGFNYDKLPFFDKILIKLLQLKLKRKKFLTPDQRGMLNVYKEPADFSRRENIKDNVAYIHSFDN